MLVYGTYKSMRVWKLYALSMYTPLLMSTSTEPPVTLAVSSAADYNRKVEVQNSLAAK